MSNQKSQLFIKRKNQKQSSTHEPPGQSYFSSDHAGTTSADQLECHDESQIMTQQQPFTTLVNQIVNISSSGVALINSPEKSRLLNTSVMSEEMCIVNQQEVTSKRVHQDTFQEESCSTTNGSTACQQRKKLKKDLNLFDVYDLNDEIIIPQSNVNLKEEDYNSNFEEMTTLIWFCFKCSELKDVDEERLVRFIEICEDFIEEAIIHYKSQSEDTFERLNKNDSLVYLMMLQVKNSEPFNTEYDYMFTTLSPLFFRTSKPARSIKENFVMTKATTGKKLFTMGRKFILLALIAKLYPELTEFNQIKNVVYSQKIKFSNHSMNLIVYEVMRKVFGLVSHEESFKIKTIVDTVSKYI